MARPKPNSFISSHPLFRNFLASNTLSLLGTNVFDIAIPLFVLEKTHSAMALAMVSVALNLPFFLMAPFTGYSADSFNRRRLMLVADLGQILCMVFLLIYDMGAMTQIWPILITVFLAKSLMQTSETVVTFQLIPSLVPAKHLSEANTWFLSSQRFIHVGGPITAGILLGTFGIRSCIVLNILSFTANLWLVYKTANLNQIIENNLGPQPTSHHTVGAVYRSFLDSCSYVWKSPLFRPFIFMMFVWNLSSFLPNTPTTTYYFTKTENLSAANYGMIVSLLGAFNMIGFLISGTLYKKFKFKRSFTGGAFCQATFALFALIFLRHPTTLAIFFALSRTAGSLVSMGTFLLRQTSIPKNRIGGVNASLRMFFMSAAPISALIQGILIDKIGVETSLVWGVVCLWGCYYFGKKVAEQIRETSETLEQEIRAA